MNKRAKIDSGGGVKKCFINHFGLPHYATRDDMHEAYIKQLVLPLIQVGRHYGLPKDLIKMLADMFRYRECPVLEFMNEPFGYSKRCADGTRKLQWVMRIHGFDVDPKTFFDFYVKLLFFGGDEQKFFRKQILYCEKLGYDCIQFTTVGRHRRYVFQFRKRDYRNQDIKYVNADLDLDEELKF